MAEFHIMNTRTPFRRCLTAIVVSSAFAAITLPAVTAADSTPPPTSPDKKLPALPVTASFGKGTPGENGGPYALTLKNTSEKSLTVNATIIWSVKSHNRAATINLPPHEIATGGTWTINDLAFEDRIILAADGFEKLELKTPPGN
jgi:hypothetical protein